MKKYKYLQNSQGNWAIFGMLPDGIQDWVADVSTETLAQTITARLNDDKIPIPLDRKECCAILDVLRLLERDVVLEIKHRSRVQLLIELLKRKI